MTDKQELLPCPFCGMAVELLSRPDKLIVILCPDDSPCRASGLGQYMLSGKRESAIATWNRRTADPELAKVTAERDEAREIERKLRLFIDYLSEQNELHASIAEKALVRAEAAESLLASRTTAIEAAIEAMEQAEACMSIVRPRSDTAEYLRILGVTRAALAQLRSLIAGKETT